MKTDHRISGLRERMAARGVSASLIVDPDDQSTQWLGGGWYDNEYRRTAEGWRLTRVRITPVWDIGARPPAEGDHA